MSAIIIVGGLLFFQPLSHYISDEKVAKSIAKYQENYDLQIKSLQKQEKSIKNTRYRSVKKEEKKRDPKIKYVGTDLYRKYVITLIDKNPEDKDIFLSNNQKDSVLVNGEIDGNQFTLQVPKRIVDSPNLKLKVVDRKTGKSQTYSADFINTLSSLSKKKYFTVKLNFSNPEKIETNIYTPEGPGAFEGIQ